MPKFSMHTFSPSPTHIPNIIKVGYMVPKKSSRQKNTDYGRCTDIWIAMSLPELSSGKTKSKTCFNPNTSKGWWGRCAKKEEGREGGEKSMCSAPTGAGA